MGSRAVRPSKEDAWKEIRLRAGAIPPEFRGEREGVSPEHPEYQRELADFARDFPGKAARAIGDNLYIEFSEEADGREYRARLRKLGIEVDDLGPRRAIFLWKRDLSVRGYLVIDNLTMGSPSLGGIRMTPTITAKKIFDLARGMTLKNSAADLPYGGGKAGIVGDPKRLAPAAKEKVVRAFAQLICHYRGEYNPGPDVGIDDEDMATIAIENGLENVVSKPERMGGTSIDKMGAAAGGVVTAFRTVLAEAYKLKALPQFRRLHAKKASEITVLVQGFGAVGSSAARMLAEAPKDKPQAGAPKVTGISDANGYLYCDSGLDVGELLAAKTPSHNVTQEYFLKTRARHASNVRALSPRERLRNIKFVNDRDGLLTESGDFLIPASPAGNYIGLEASGGACVALDRAGRWSFIVEGANTYDNAREARYEREKLERVLYRERGTFIATDYLVNSGGVIFAACEKLEPTPAHLSIPDKMRGDRRAVEGWLRRHARAFRELSRKREALAVALRDRVVRANIQALVAGLVRDEELLPCQAAVRIAVERIAGKSFVRDAMVAPAIVTTRDVDTRALAKLLVTRKVDMVPVVSEDGALEGVVTDWDVTRSVADGRMWDKVAQIMTPASRTVSARATDSILFTIRRFEKHDISAMPVVDERNRVIGVITADDLVRKTLLQFLQKTSPRK